MKTFQKLLRLDIDQKVMISVEELLYIGGDILLPAYPVPCLDLKGCRKIFRLKVEGKILLTNSSNKDIRKSYK